MSPRQSESAWQCETETLARYSGLNAFGKATEARGTEGACWYVQQSGLLLSQITQGGQHQGDIRVCIFSSESLPRSGNNFLLLLESLASIFGATGVFASWISWSEQTRPRFTKQLCPPTLEAQSPAPALLVALTFIGISDVWNVSPLLQIYSEPTTSSSLTDSVKHSSLLQKIDASIVPSRPGIPTLPSITSHLRSKSS